MNRAIRFLHRRISATQRFLTRVQAAIVLDTSARCPGCVGADEFADAMGRPRINHRPAVFAVKTNDGVIALACAAHAPLVQNYEFYTQKG